MTGPDITLTVTNPAYQQGWNDAMTTTRDSYLAMSEALTAQSEAVTYQRRTIHQEGIRYALDEVVAALNDRQRFADWCDAHDVSQAVLSTARAHERAARYLTHLLTPEIQ